jgi:hypothetical protein
VPRYRMKKPMMHGGSSGSSTGCLTGADGFFTTGAGLALVAGAGEFSYTLRDTNWRPTWASSLSSSFLRFNERPANRVRAWRRPCRIFWT